MPSQEEVVEQQYELEIDKLRKEMWSEIVGLRIRIAKLEEFIHAHVTSEILLKEGDANV